MKHARNSQSTNARRAAPRPREVIFLGAGASKPLGHPLTDQIMPLILTALKDNRLFEQYVSGARDRKDLRKLLSRLFPGVLARGRDGRALSSILSVLSLVDYLLVAKQPPCPRYNTTELSRLQVLLEQAVCDVLYADSEEPGAEKFLAKFVRWLQSKSRDAHLTVVTTNYDVSVETAMFDDITRRIERRLAAANGRAPSEELILHESQRVIAREFDFGFAWREAWNGANTTYGRPTGQTCKMRWYKLHGSFNWLRCDLCGHIYINPNYNIADLAFADRADPDTSCHCGHFPLRAVLVTPSYIRDMRDSNLLEIWRHAFEELREASKWTFIGYSFPEEDIAIRSLLMRAYHGSSHRRPAKINVVSMSSTKEFKARVLTVFPKARFTKGGAESFIEMALKRGRPARQAAKKTTVGSKHQSSRKSPHPIARR